LQNDPVPRKGGIRPDESRFFGFYQDSSRLGSLTTASIVCGSLTTGRTAIEETGTAQIVAIALLIESALTAASDEGMRQRYHRRWRTTRTIDLPDSNLRHSLSPSCMQSPARWRTSQFPRRPCEDEASHGRAASKLVVEVPTTGNLVWDTTFTVCRARTISLSTSAGVIESWSYEYRV